MSLNEIGFRLDARAILRPGDALRSLVRDAASTAASPCPWPRSCGGHDGGLNKTGTLEGVRTLAGYADASSDGRVRFVISLTSNDRQSVLTDA
jgi:hypothetical protein